MSDSFEGTPSVVSFAPPSQQAGIKESLGNVESHASMARKSVGLIQLGLRNLSASTTHETSVNRLNPASEDHKIADRAMLQLLLATEASREEAEGRNTRLNSLFETTSKACTEAETGSRLKSEFLATMSHEMRTPLNGIIGMTSILLSRELGLQERDYIETIHQAGEALRCLVDDVLDFSKIEAGKLNLEKLDFKPSSALMEALRIVQPAAAQKATQIIVKIDDAVPEWVVGDKSRLRQILLNLLSNAVKFSEKGTIDVKVSARLLENHQCELKFSVKDQGIGISEDQISKLFRPFAQAEDSTARQYGGTGLGLAICKRLVQLMAGEIGVNSRYGEGSEFWFVIQVQTCGEPPKLSSQPPQGVVDAASLPPARILLAEDNTLNQKVAAIMLQKLGHSVDIVRNGLEAISAAQKNDYDLILMDCRMPSLDGLEATRRLRGCVGPVSDIPVIAMTASAFDEDRVACLKAGMDDFISKPVYEADLCAKLSFWLKPDRKSVCRLDSAY